MTKRTRTSHLHLRLTDDEKRTLLENKKRKGGKSIVSTVMAAVVQVPDEPTSMATLAWERATPEFRKLMEASHSKFVSSRFRPVGELYHTEWLFLVAPVTGVTEGTPQGVPVYQSRTLPYIFWRVALSDSGIDPQGDPQANWLGLDVADIARLMEKVERKVPHPNYPYRKTPKFVIAEMRPDVPLDAASTMVLFYVMPCPADCVPFQYLRLDSATGLFEYQLFWTTFHRDDQRRFHDQVDRTFPGVSRDPARVAKNEEDSEDDSYQ